MSRSSIGLLLIAAAFVAPNLHAGRPLAVDDAEPVAPRQFEIEAGMRYSSDGRITHYDVPFGITYGVVPRVELGVSFGSQIEERDELQSRKQVISDMGDLVLGGKAKLLDATNAWLSHAFAFGVKFPTADHCDGFGTGRFDYDLMWIATRPITENWNAHANVGYTFVGRRSGEDYRDLLHYGVATDYQITRTLQLVLELYASMPIDDANATSAFVNGGVRWSPTPGLVIDTALGCGVRGETPTWMITSGLTWSFGPH